MNSPEIVPPPIRLVTRLLAEMQTNVIEAGLRAMGGNLDQFTIYTLIVRQSLGGGGAISAHSLAHSLARPYETVRRHIGALIARGLCYRAPNGIAASPEALDAGPISEAVVAAHDGFVRFVEDLAMLGIPLPQPRSGIPYSTRVAVQAAADMLLAVMDSNRGTHHDWTELVLFSTVMCANARNYARDPVLARRHADERTPPPESIRLPVRPSVAARVIGVSESTARRRFEAMVGDGRLIRTQRGLLVSEDWMNQPAQVETSRSSYYNIKRILERVAAAGFPFGAPASVYLRGRPADTRFA